MPTAQFTHGVASGDPRPTSVVLWTRVTPTTASTPGSGVGPDVSVGWQVSTNSRFTDIVRSGTFRTGPARDHTVKVDATGLQPGRTYYYRFSYGSVRSATGRTRTAPAATASPANLRLGVVSCANLQAGWFSSYRHLADRDDLHAVLHLGDYIYEYGPGQYGYGQGDVDIRPHEPAHEILKLADYRRRHGQYKRDTDLQRLHAKYAFIVTWDDHESANDAYKDGAENHNPGEGTWAARRAAAHKAYDEWMPVRMNGTAALGDGTALYRRLTFGDLVEISMLDLRTYRDVQLAAQVDPAQADPARTITGRQQMDWLKESLTRQVSQWKLVGNPVMISPVTFAGLPTDLVKPVNDTVGLLPPDGAPYNVDQWDGYTDDRREVFEHLRDNGVTDSLFITGDIHSGWACDLPADKATYLGTRDSVGVEFVATSVTSSNLKDITGTPRRTTSVAAEEILKANNPHIKYLNFDDHGFSVLDITPKRAQMDWFIIGDRASRTTGATWNHVLGDHGGQPDHPPGLRPGGVLMAGVAASRRTVLKVAGASGAAMVFSSVAGVSPAGAATARRRAYVLVVDGCRPGEIDAMSNLKALRDGGTWYPAARSLPVMETIPNHVMMMTGCRPARNGVPANDIYDRTEGAVRHCDRPTDIKVATIIEQLNASGRTTGTVLSKEYLYSVFGERATHRWEPFPVIPVSGHSPDAATMDAALAMVEEFDPDFTFVNLGDVDRVGHSDLTGTTLKVARAAALASTNEQVGRFVDLLKSSGRWASSMVLVLADHSMDWSVPTQTISLTSVFEADATLAGRFTIAQNGGADLVYWTGPGSERGAALARMRSLALGTAGVFQAHVIAQTPSLRLGTNAGDLLVYCKAGWRFSDPGPESNPIPGNHGHPATEPIPFFIGGGSAVVRKGVARSAKAHTMDVAPTLGAYFGVKAPTSGWEGSSRL